MSFLSEEIKLKYALNFLNILLLLWLHLYWLQWTSSSGSNAQGYSSVSTDKIVAADSKPAQGATIGVGSQPPSLEKSSSIGRKELPLVLSLNMIHSSLVLFSLL